MEFKMQTFSRVSKWIIVLSLPVLFGLGCTQETQNQISRSVQNWTGTNGVLEVYAGQTLVKRFLQIDKMSTAEGTNTAGVRPYRYGYGVLDTNLNGVVDAGEKKVYFEISDYSTSYVFYSAP
jgi:hypothetical protein